MCFNHKMKPRMLGKITFTLTVLSSWERRPTERINIGFLETEKKGQQLKIVIRPVLERSSRKLSLQLNLNMLQLRGSTDIVIIMLGWKESFTCGSVWLTGLQLWWPKTAAVCPNYRGPWRTAQDAGFPQRKCCVIRKKDEAFVVPFLSCRIANRETNRRCCSDEHVCRDLTRC